MIIINKFLGDYPQPRLRTPAVSAGGHMPKTAVWLIIIFTLLFILGINTGDLDYLNNLGNTM